MNNHSFAHSVRSFIFSSSSLWSIVWYGVREDKVCYTMLRYAMIAAFIATPTSNTRVIFDCDYDCN